MGILGILPRESYVGVIMKIKNEDGGYQHMFFPNNEGTAEGLKKIRENLVEAIRQSRRNDEVLEGIFQGSGPEIEARIIALNRAANQTGTGSMSHG